jgi:Ulp1 family protease
MRSSASAAAAKGLGEPTKSPVGASAKKGGPAPKFRDSGATAQKKRPRKYDIENLENNDNFTQFVSDEDDYDPTVLNMTRAMSLSKRDLECLLYRNRGLRASWLNDNVVMCYMLNELPRIDERILIVDTLIWEGNFPRNVRNVVFPVFRDDWEYAVFPINELNTHWMLSIASRDGRVKMFNTMGGMQDKSYEPKIRRILQGLSENIDVTFDYVDRDTYYQQRDGYSCGPGICMLTERFFKNESLKFTGDDTLNWREYAYSILENQAGDLDNVTVGDDVQEILLTDKMDESVQETSDDDVKDSSYGIKKKKRKRFIGRKQREKIASL